MMFCTAYAVGSISNRQSQGCGTSNNFIFTSLFKFYVVFSPIVVIIFSFKSCTQNR